MFTCNVTKLKEGFYLFFDYFCDIMKESMEDNRSQLLNYSIYASLFLGIFWVVKYLLANIGGENAVLNFLSSLLSFGTPVILFYFLTRYNSRYLDDKISFGQGIQFSILLFFFASIWEAVVVFIHVNWIDPAYIANLYSSLVEIARSINLSEALTAQLAEQPLPSSFNYVVSNIILGDVFIGLLLSLLIVPIVRYLVTKKENNFTD